MRVCVCEGGGGGRVVGITEGEISCRQQRIEG